MCDEEWTAADEASEEVWEVRRRIWERFDNDPVKYGNYLRELCEQLARAGLIKVQFPRGGQGKSAT